MIITFIKCTLGNDVTIVCPNEVVFIKSTKKTDVFLKPSVFLHLLNPQVIFQEKRDVLCLGCTFALGSM